VKKLQVIRPMPTKETDGIDFDSRDAWQVVMGSIWDQINVAAATVDWSTLEIETRRDEVFGAAILVRVMAEPK
jgi:hypothetical protein